MTSSARSVDELATDLGNTDFNVRARALAELVQRGREATPALLGILSHRETEIRVQAVRGLSAIADPACADVFIRLLEDEDERIRAYAGQGLARVRDSRALDALLRTIDDFPDVLRQPYTPAVDELIALGPAALPKIVLLLDAANPATRAHAFTVLREILSVRPETGDWHALWHRLGSYEPAAPEPQRADASKQWRDWIARHFS